MGAPAQRLGLGTAQFGLAYGVANARRPSREETRAALELAARAGVGWLDTAPGYGDAERLLGELCPGGGSFRLVTKTAGDGADGRDPRADLQASLARLRTAKVHALLEHRPERLLGADGAKRYSALAALREEGLVEKIGASVYARAELDALLARHPLDVIQLPLSILDQRLVQDGTLARLRERGVEVHARSLLLQGALTLAPEALPPFLAPLRGAIARVQSEARARDLSLAALAVSFALSLPEVAVALLGVANAAQLGDALAGCAERLAPGELAPLAAGDAALLDPSRWSRQP